MDTSCRYSLVLVPSAHDVTHRISQFALDHFKPTDYLCGFNSRPHVTLVQVKTTTDQADRLKACLRPLLDRHMPLILAEYYLDIKDKDFWTGFAVQKSAALQALHEDAIALLTADGFVANNKQMDAYRPHLTLCRTDIMPSIIQADLTGLSFDAVTAFGPSGPNWTFPLV